MLQSVTNQCNSVATAAAAAAAAVGRTSLALLAAEAGDDKQTRWRSNVGEQTGPTETAAD